MIFETHNVLIGLGGQRCGSSWLHEVLSRHPDVVPASGGKEVHFFDKNWDRGADWYRNLWPRVIDEGRFIWESTPSYLYGDDTPDRIAATVPTPKFVVLLRDPVTRSRSHFQRYQVNSGQTLLFADAVAQRGTILKYSTYSGFLSAFFDRFGRENMFVGFYEDIARRPNELLHDIHSFAGMEAVALSAEQARRRVNARQNPRSGAGYSAVFKARNWLRDHGFENLVTVARKAGAIRLLTSPKASAKINQKLEGQDLDRLLALREDQVVALGALGIDASHWNIPLQQEIGVAS
ncbi:MAG: sulfotransferase [Pseudomonadota bacterium]